MADHILFFRHANPSIHINPFFQILLFTATLPSFGRPSPSSRRKMSTPGRLPIYYEDSENEPVRRQHTARYYAHRVTESLTTRVSKMICTIFLSLLFLFGLIAFIFWLSLRPHRPRFHIEDFSIPGLAQPTGFENAEITFNVTDRNSNQKIGIFYDSVDATVYYKDQQIGSTPLADPFYQEPKTTKVFSKTLSGVTLTVNSGRWSEFMNDRQQGSVPFRLGISSTIQFKVFSWESKHHKMHVNCDVSVGPDGTILPAYKDTKCPIYFS